jgi:tripartite-type tricarboxylate transporter receptor subunit TctC
MTKMKILRCIVPIAATLLAFGPAHAQDAYPSKPVRLVVPFAAAGPADLIARIIGQKLSEELGKQFYVETHAGAGGNIRTAHLPPAPADR